MQASILEDSSDFLVAYVIKETKPIHFNIWYSSADYETWGYGKEHLPTILEDLGTTEGDDVYVD